MASVLREAVRSLHGARLRTLLGLVGIAIGIASVIAMVSTGKIATVEARRQFEAVGTDLLSVRKSDHMKRAAPGQGPSIGLQHALDLADTLSTVSEAAPRIRLKGTFRYDGRSVGSGSLQGVSASFLSVNRLNVAEGRFVSDMDTGRYFAVVGSEVAKAMRSSGAGEIVGDILDVDGRLHIVVGILAHAPETYALPFQVEANGSVFVPITTMRRTDPDAEITLIIARTAPDTYYPDAAREIETYFSARTRGLVVEVTSAEQLIEQMQSQLGLMTLLLAAIGSISLIVGGIGVMNFMLISVNERRQEIGVRRALGATRGDIRRQFLSEALILTLGGGIAGVVTGNGVAYGICHYFDWEFFLSPMSIVAGFGVSTVVGLFFGFQPAHQASRLDPIVALQGE